MLWQEKEAHRKKVQLNTLEYIYSNIFDKGMVMQVLTMRGEFERVQLCANSRALFAKLCQISANTKLSLI